MNIRHPARPRHLALALLVIALVTRPAVPAQQTSPLTLDDILQRLEDNLLHYDSTVPSLYCAEHVVSSMVGNFRSQNAITDSTFRLKRVLNPDQTTNLNESREIKAIDGHPAEAEALVGPAIVSGAFSGGLATVSISQKPCMRYRLRPAKSNRPGTPYIVEFESLFNQTHPADCLLQEDGHGRVFIDPTTMQIKRMELTAPRHTMYPGGKSDNGSIIQPVVGEWILAVDYSPVLLGGKTFWLPTTITSRATSGNGGPGATIWSFDAKYTNYHKLEVTSRILVPGDPAVP